MKSNLRFLGTSVGDIRQVIKEFSKQHPDLSRRDIVAVAEALWSKPVHERRMAAVVLLESHVDDLSPSDLHLIERLIRGSKTWALVDGLAGTVVGGMLLRHPHHVEDTVDRWSRDEDFWIRRAALLAHLKRLRAGGDLATFSEYADRMLHEKEFFIRKAIGWVLREAAKVRPRDVYEWLAPRTDVVSGVTVREAVKYLEPSQRDRILAAYKSRRVL